MEELIRQAFLHVDVIGPHVAEGHYDLVGPNGTIILPQVWEMMIQQDWAITMHMWPMPEPPRGPPDGVRVVDYPPPRRARRGPPPPEWTVPDVIVIEDNAATKKSKDRKKDTSGGVLNIFGSSSSSNRRKSSGKGK